MAEYIPLYRKYRPQTIEQIVGQSHIKQALTNAIELGKISHAYLFTGPRGTGKTSTARILAKSLNCVNGPTVKPCGECASCQDITNSVPIDVIEIDAASNRKVEDAQNILEKIQYVPVNGKFKIYIIDEVHMLTNTAFNALLKTLEEPPKNVVFILATTEAHKVLDTIKSRCQRFDFRRITTDDIANHLRYISDKEEIKISDEALLSIAKSSAGGMRDSIALLDQVSILGESKEITEEDINNLLGRISFDILHDIADAIINSDPINSVKIIEKIYNSGNEPVQILTNLMTYFKNLLIAKNCDKDSIVQLTNLNEESIKKLTEQKEKIETHQIIFLIEKTADYIKEIKLTTAQQMWLEVAIIDLANLTNNTKLLELQERLSALEGGNIAVARPHPIISQPEQKVEPQTVKESAVQENKPQPQPQPAIQEEVSQVEEFSPMPKAKMFDPSSDIKTLWGSLLSNIKSSPTQAILKLANPVKISPEEVIITFKQEMFVKRASEDSKKSAIVEAANIMFNQKDTPVTIRLPQNGDVDLGKISTPIKQITKTESIPQEKKTGQTKTSNNKDSSDDSDELDEIEQISQPVEPEIESDQSKMIKQLFDGKYIN